MSVDTGQGLKGHISGTLERKTIGKAVLLTVTDFMFSCCDLKLLT
jgi:hypothetical protein